MDSDKMNLYRSSSQDFRKIPGFPITYWVNANVQKSFEKDKLNQIVKAVKGLDTCDNEKYLRHWFEPPYSNISITANCASDTRKHDWYPYCKGGNFRRWYGNLEKVVLWKNDGEILRNLRDGNGKIKSRPQNTQYYFKEGLTWSTICSSKLSMRLMKNMVFGGGGSGMFSDENPYYLLGLMNSAVIPYYLSLLNPTMNILVGDILSIPYVSDDIKKSRIITISKNSVTISKTDWDSFETSWDFQTHPFLTHNGATLEESYKNWEKFADSQFAQLKSNEEELNRIFIDIYGLQDELTPEVKDEDVTIRKADLVRDVKSFISYAVGCMFGRYSIDKPGLILANAGETVADYKAKVPNSRFEIDDDNIIPVLDDDYFHDDIVSRFREFLKVVYGKETLEQNMSFIAHALSPESKATPDKVLRDYFLKDFYADHLKIYQKRPIYWMFTSGKQQGFNALIYMHRYNKDTLGKIWGDYLRELEAKLDAEIALLENAEKKNTSQLAKLKKQRIELKEYDADLDIVASEKIEIDLDDGVSVNYAKFGKLVRPLK